MKLQAQNSDWPLEYDAESNLKDKIAGTQLRKYSLIINNKMRCGKSLL